MTPQILPVLTIPHPHLRRISKPISNTRDPKIQGLFPLLIATMKKEDGVGLAAPQIDLPLRMIVVDTIDGPKIFINPQLRKKSWRKQNGEEGCLSVPGIFGMVKRHASVVLDALDEHGQPLSLKAEGLFSRILQHEIDHLDGILFIDRMTSLTKGRCEDLPSSPSPEGVPQP